MTKNFENNITFKYFHYVAILFVLSFVLSNILAVKIANVYNFEIPAGMVVFPLSYILSDLLTEVYGFQRARQLIWFTVFCEFLVVVFSRIAISLPSSSYWPYQDAFSTVLGPEWRITAASCIAYLLGDFTNCSIISKLKIKFGNRFIALRFIGSTAVGVLVDNTIFTILAFTGVLPYQVMAWLIVGQYIVKIAYETMMAPITVRASIWLKNKEGVDIYDIDTKFELFKFKIDNNLEKNKYESLQQTQ